MLTHARTTGMSGYGAHCSIAFSLPYSFLLPVVLSLVVSCCLRAVVRGLLAVASCRLRPFMASLINYSYGRKQCLLTEGKVYAAVSGAIPRM